MSGGDWVAIQEKAFTRWCNDKLKVRGMHINDLTKDCADGLILINLLEIISAKSLGRYNKNPVVPLQKVENNAIVLNFLKAEGIKTVNIGPEDITFGKQKLILGLIWTIILRYQIQGIEGDATEGKARSELLEWVRSKIPEYNITGFTKDWNNGKAICGLVHALDPTLCTDHWTMDPSRALANATRGMDDAYTVLGVPVIVEPVEMVNPKLDDHAMMTQIACFRDLEASGAFKRRDDALKCRAYGDGLTDGIVDQESKFVVEVPPGCRGKLEVKVVGPKTSAVAVVVRNGDCYSVSYTPTEPGTWQVHVTLDRVHVPGSIFTVIVLARESLGGEGKIRIFYSTTTSKNVITRPLQELLESKGIHLRPDFEPWIAVDVMEKDDREAVFRVAGTRKLPIIYVDDIYRGSTDEMFALEKAGELDRLLAVNRAHYDELYGPGKRSQYLTSSSGGATTSSAARSSAGSPKPKPAPAASSAPPPPVARPSSGPGAAKAPAPSAGANFCGNCGTKLQAGAKFCTSCGTKQS